MLLLKPYFNPDPASTDGGGTPPPTTPPDETVEFATLNGKDAATLTDQEKTRLTELQGKYEVVLKDGEGNPLTPEQIAEYKETEAKFNTILAKPEDQRTQEEKDFLEANKAVEEPDPKSIYDQVDEIRGVKYNIDYEGVDPTSAEGIARREQVIADQAAREYDNQLKTKYGRAYQFMLHLSQGGKEEDFFKPENQDFLALSIKKDDPNQQERILRSALAAKGNSPAIIEAAITAMKDGNLYETAKGELEALQAAQKQREKQREEISERQRLKEEQEVNQFSTQLDTAIEKGFDGIVIPKVDRQKFQEFIYNQLDYYNGNFIITKKVDPKELSKTLKAAYFEFKGGDLKALVDRSAATKVALKFKNSIKTEVTPRGSQQSKPKFVPMGSL